MLKKDVEKYLEMAKESIITWGFDSELINDFDKYSSHNAWNKEKGAMCREELVNKYYCYNGSNEDLKFILECFFDNDLVDFLNHCSKDLLDIGELEPIYYDPYNEEINYVKDREKELKYMLMDDGFIAYLSMIDKKDLFLRIDNE